MDYSRDHDFEDYLSSLSPYNVSASSRIESGESKRLYEEARKEKRDNNLMRALDCCRKAVDLDRHNHDASILLNELERFEATRDALIDRVRRVDDLTLDEIAELLSDVSKGFSDHPDVIVECRINDIRRRRVKQIKSSASQAVSEGYYREAKSLLNEARRTDPNDTAIGMSLDYVLDSTPNMIKEDSDSFSEFMSGFHKLGFTTIPDFSTFPTICSYRDTDSPCNTMDEFLKKYRLDSSDPLDQFKGITGDSHFRSVSRNRYIDSSDSGRTYRGEIDLKDGKPQK